MKLNILAIFLCWLIGMMVSYNNMQGVLAVTCMSIILFMIYILDDSLPVNPTHIEYEGKKYPTLTHLIKHIKKNH